MGNSQGSHQPDDKRNTASVSSEATIESRLIILEEGLQKTSVCVNNILEIVSDVVQIVMKRINISQKEKHMFEGRNQEISNLLHARPTSLGTRDRKASFSSKKQQGSHETQTVVKYKSRQFKIEERPSSVNWQLMFGIERQIMHFQQEMDDLKKKVYSERTSMDEIADIDENRKLKILNTRLVKLEEEVRFHGKETSYVRERQDDTVRTLSTVLEGTQRMSDRYQESLTKAMESMQRSHTHWEEQRRQHTSHIYAIFRYLNIDPGELSDISDN